jgi:hypothetical protein
MLNLRLNSQVQALRAGNAALADQNALTAKQLSAAGSAGALEEAARKQGYTRPGEQVYVIVKPTPAATQPAAPPSVGQQAGKQVGGAVEAIQRWWRNLWH